MVLTTLNQCPLANVLDVNLIGPDFRFVSSNHQFLFPMVSWMNVVNNGALWEFYSYK